MCNHGPHSVGLAQRGSVFASSHLMHTLFLIALGSSGRWNAALAWLACLSRKYGSMHAWRRRCQSSALQRQSHLRLVILNRSVRPACRMVGFDFRLSVVLASQPLHTKCTGD